MIRGPAVVAVVVGVVVGPWSVSGAFGQAATTAGAVATPSPTTQGISIEWPVIGDDNANGVVAVRYRPAGTTAFKVGMPLFRVPAGMNTSGTFGSGGGTWGNKHAGSLFDLDAGTTYEIELTLTDPDGGSTSTTTTAATRPIPLAAADAVTKPVTPATFTAALAAAAPGDILLLGAGSYPAFTLARDGTAGHPIVLRGENADAAVIGGRVTMSDRRWIFLENLTVMGEVRMNGASNMVVRGCKIRTTAGGITFEMGNAVPRDNFIVDNDLVGGATWIDDQLSADGYDGGEGIQFTGSGHVVCFNHVKDFRDDISLMEYDEAYEQTSIDICNNDIEEATDDAIEADSAMGNVRVLRNRIRNCFDGVSAQPDLGGPTYYVRNVMFNVLYTPFKFHNGTVGDVALHNTVVKCGDGFGCYAGETWSRAFLRNNLFVGGSGGGTYGGYQNGSGRVLDLGDADATCSFDYDGVGSIGTGKFEGKIGAARFTDLASLRANTSEAHAVAVDLGVFATAVSFPSSPYPPKPIADLRLAPGGAAVDTGLAIAGINDEFSGAAPDLGAYEVGAAVPTYGPRTDGGGTGAAGAGGAGSGASGGAGGDASAVGQTASGGAPGAGRGGSGLAAMGGAPAPAAGGSTGQAAGGALGSGATEGATKGTTKGAGSGCGCATAAPPAPRGGVALLLGTLALAWSRRARPPRRRRPPA